METTVNTGNTAQKETKWYVLRVISGKEKKVKEYLDKEIEKLEKELENLVPGGTPLTFVIG